MIRESNNVYGTLRHERGVPGVAGALAAQGWAVRNASWYEREVRGDWFEFVLAPEPDDVLLSGAVEPDRLDDLAALLRSTGATVSLELYDDDRNLMREVGPDEP